MNGELPKFNDERQRLNKENSPQLSRFKACDDVHTSNGRAICLLPAYYRLFQFPGQSARAI
jgi:hypothetical protein